MKIYEGTKDEKEFFPVEGEELKDAAKRGLWITMISFPNTELNPVRVASEKRLDATDCDAVAKTLGVFGIDSYKLQEERMNLQ